MIAERRLTALPLSLIANVLVNVFKDFISARREEWGGLRKSPARGVPLAAPWKGSLCFEKLRIERAAQVESATLRKFQVAPLPPVDKSKGHFSRTYWSDQNS